MKSIKKFFVKIARSNKPVVIEYLFELSPIFFIFALVVLAIEVTACYYSGGMMADKADLVGKGAIVLVTGLIASISLLT